jgi:hypothetical protein
MTEGRQPFTAEIKTLAKGPSTYDPLENNIRKQRSFPDIWQQTRLAPQPRLSMMAMELSGQQQGQELAHCRNRNIGSFFTSAADAA